MKSDDKIEAELVEYMTLNTKRLKFEPLKLKEPVVTVTMSEFGSHYILTALRPCKVTLGADGRLLDNFLVEEI